MNVVLIALALIQLYIMSVLDFPSESSYVSMMFSADHSLPRIPFFIIFYYSVNFLLIFCGVFFAVKGFRADLSQFLLSVLILLSIVNFFHAFVPVHNAIRPVVKSDGFFLEAINSLYVSVKPYNTFPSWHAAAATLCAIIYFKQRISEFRIIKSPAGFINQCFRCSSDFFIARQIFFVVVTIHFFGFVNLIFNFD